MGSEMVEYSQVGDQWFWQVVTTSGNIVDKAGPFETEQAASDNYQLWHDDYGS